MASTTTQTLNASIGAVAAPTRFVETGGRRLAYRSIGSGTPIVLATRFRGTMDYWDPAFLDALVDNDFQVVTFDYSGLGHSTGEKTYDAGSLAKDAGDLIEALDLEDVVMSGWSLGGVAAQVALALFPERIGHAVLLATTPPGHLVKQGDELFYDTVSKPAPDLEDEVTIFFEPASAASREAARASRERIAQRTTDRGEDVPVEWRWPSWAASRATRCFRPRTSWRFSSPPQRRSCTSAETTTSSSRSRTGTPSTSNCRLSSC